MRGLGRLEEAVASYQQALAIRPGNPEALSNRGHALFELRYYEEAATSYQQALTIRPDYAEALNNRGSALLELNLLSEALACYNEAIAIDPDNADAKFNRSLCELLQGNFPRGWQDYEQRWLRNKAPGRRHEAYPLLLGAEDLSGRTILLHAEQGLGDTIQFVRYASLLRQCGARVLVEVQPPLKALIGRLPFDVEVFAQGEPLPLFDLQSPLLSLPLVCNTTESTIPWPGAYLSAPVDRLRRWRNRLGEKVQPRVGIAWSGSGAGHRNDLNRTIALDTMSELLKLPVDWVCLQKEIPASDYATSKRLQRLRQFADEIGDFADTAALVACCDLVISIDTAVAHLAGAMGKPVWILLPHVPDWRWLLDREDSPWYPTARLFRQPRTGDWPSVIDRVCEELRAQNTHPEDAAISPSRQPDATLPQGNVANLPQLLDLAIAHHQNGRLAEAERIYSRILKVQSTHFDAVHLLGVIRHQQGRQAEALDLIGSALKINPRSSDALLNQGSVLHHFECYRDALASYDRALAIHPNNARAHYNRGLALKELGRLEEAVASYERALVIQPDHADVLNNHGSILLHLKRFDEALASFDQGLAIRPHDATALNNRGNALLGLKRAGEALASYDQALTLEPGYAEAHRNRAIALKELERLEEALRSYDEALALKPDYLEALHGRGATLLQLKRFEEAIDTYDRLLAIRPDHMPGLYNRGNALKELNRADEALRCYDRALALKPHHVGALHSRANALRDLKRFEEALATFDRALAIRPDDTALLNNRGNVLKDLGRLQEALSSYEFALALRPDFRDALNNRGLALVELARYEEALESCDRAIQLDPDHAEHRFNRSLLLLLLGSYRNGWREYEWRKKRQSWGERRFGAPEWAGESISGQRVLLYGEQGLGDTIQFVRYAALVEQLGARVLIEVRTPLKDLMRTLPFGVEVIARGEPLPEFDFQCPLLTLPSLFETDEPTIPWSGAYLTAEEERLRRWQKRLGEKVKPRVGVAWSGSATHGNDRNRSICLETIGELFDLPVEWVCLHKEIRGGDRAVLPRFGQLRHFADEIADFADTAALIACCDLVISVDTSVAHLAGAMGRPVWVLLPY